MSSRLTITFVALALAMPSGGASAQWPGWFGGGSDVHHHHDAAGHMIDDHGHHIDNHGNHTGWQGIFEGDHSHEPHYSGGWSNNYSPNYSGSRTTYYSPNSANYVAPNALPQAHFTGEPIEIKLSSGAQGSVNYMLNQYRYAIGAGQSQSIRSDRSWTIAFDRGANFGLAKYSLSPGQYEFNLTDRGWELNRQQLPQPALAPTLSPPPPVAPANVAPAPVAAPATASTPAPNSVN